VPGLVLASDQAEEPFDGEDHPRGIGVAKSVFQVQPFYTITDLTPAPRVE
jgi:hypothetical protein